MPHGWHFMPVTVAALVASVWMIDGRCAVRQHGSWVRGLEIAVCR